MKLFTDKFEYDVSESAPKGYVMRIIVGRLGYEDGAASVPSMADNQNGWGQSWSANVVGPDRKPLPHSLSIAFFSYTENQFYRGSFELPYDKILKLFKEGHYSPKDNKHITYSTLVVGVAPGGAVAVWAESLDKTTEVFFGQAEKANIDWEIMTQSTLPRDRYIQETLLEYFKTPEAVAAVLKNPPPADLWARYRIRYPWQPVFTDIPLREGRVSYIGYFNGERDYWDYPLDKTTAAQTRPLPKEMIFVWENTPDRGRMLEVYFNEAEIFGAFQKLGGQGQRLQLEVRPSPLGAKDIVELWLRNDKDAVHLIHADIKNYGAGPNKKSQGSAR